MEIKEVTEGVFHIEMETQYDLASSFMRVQEFYESPFDSIRGHFFTHEQYMDIHARSNDRSGSEEIKFTYLEDWAGFNVPGDVFNKWLGKFPKQSLWKKEQALIDLLRTKLKKKTKKFYVIGTYEDGDATVIDHELSHAWFYLDPEYKRAMLKLVRKFPKYAKTQLRQYMKDDGYTSNVFDDELVAYMSTNSMYYTKKQFEDKEIPWDKILEFQLAFCDYKDEKFDKAD